MSYASGLMLGTAIVQGLKGLMGGNASMGGMGNGMGGGMRGKSGFPFGASNMFDNQNINLPKIPAANIQPNFKTVQAEPFKLISALPGRRRYRAENISGKLKILMEGNISKLDYVNSIEVNPVSGSILITFDEVNEDKIFELEQWMKARLFAPNYAAFERDARLNKMLYGSITNSVKNTVEHVSNIIIRESHGMLDIKSLFSMIFVVLGFRKVILNGEAPSGIQMLWWAVSLMRGIKAI